MRRRSPRRKGLLIIAVVVVLAGCNGVMPGETTDRQIPEELGEVDGVAYDEELDIDPEDGFTEEELEAFTKRTMARIEAIRGLEFQRTVDVEIFTREEYRERRANRSTTATESAWENQIWRSLFIIGQDRNATAEINDAFGGAVQGFYQPGQDRIVIVSDSEQQTVDKATLIHELVHALQEQQFGLEFGHETRDEQAAYDTLIEGEADLIPRLYLEEWCQDWSCLRPELAMESSDGGGTDIDLGVFLVLTQPYVQGVEFVEEVRADGGWEAVDELHEEPPRSTAGTIYSEYDPQTPPAQIEIEERSTTEWKRFDHTPEGDTLGAGALYSMFVTNEIIDEDDPSDYGHPAIEGWTGDRLVPYRSGDEFGYVWELTWESNDDAVQFADTYRELLDSHGALARGEASHVIPDGPFEGAYRVTVDGDHVRITNGPDLGALDEIHPPYPD